MCDTVYPAASWVGFRIRLRNRTWVRTKARVRARVRGRLRFDEEVKWNG